MSERKLFLEVTWPDCKTLGPIQRSNQLASLLCQEERKLRRDLVCVRDDGIYIRGLFGRENKVPDVDRYKIVRAEESRQIAVVQHEIAEAAQAQSANSANNRPFVSTYPYVDRAVATGCDRPTLVIVLESPHRDEYGESVATPIAPARGSTGARIHKFLSIVLNSCRQIRQMLFERAPVRVVISNPIPFQTSAYAIHGGRLGASDRLRDFIWRELWCDPTLGLKDMFGEKLGSYTPIAVVNACTTGGKPSRRDCVRDFIQCRYAAVPLYKANHPSTWGSNTSLTLERTRGAN